MDRLVLWWRHQETTVTLITTLVFFESSQIVQHSSNVSQLGLNCFGIYDEGFRLTTPELSVKAG